MRINDWSSDVCSSDLDLGIPIGALDQTHHQAMAAALSQIDDIIDDERRTLLIGLNYKANAVPSGKLRVKAQSLKDIQRKIQTVSLFRIDIQPYVVTARQLGQLGAAGQQFGHHAVALSA